MYNDLTETYVLCHARSYKSYVEAKNMSTSVSETDVLNSSF